MGRDKALLDDRGIPLAGRVAAAVAAAAGSATLVGDPEKYGHLGYPVLPDRIPGAGPLGGIETALSHTPADWNLVLACDMPGITPEFLLRLLAAAENCDCDAVLASGPSGMPEPLAAVYHRRCAGALRNALEAGTRKVTDALAGLAVRRFAVSDAASLENLNTPEEWAFYHDAH